MGGSGGAVLRKTSYGQATPLTWVDRLGVYLSLRKIMAEFKPFSGGVKKRVLDLGCGYHGLILRHIAAAAGSTVGVDLVVSPQLKDMPGVAISEQPIEEFLPGCRDCSFDLVVMNSVLEHLNDPRAVLVQCKRILAEGGVLVLNVPTWRGKDFLEFLAYRLRLCPAEEIEDHKAYYNKNDLWTALVGAGFKPSGIRMSYHKCGLNLFARVAV